MKVCPNCGYDKNSEDALYCNLCHEVFVKKKKESSGEPPLYLEDLPADLKEKLVYISSQQKNLLFPKRLFFGILILLLAFIVGLIIWLIITYFTVLTLTYSK